MDVSGKTVAIIGLALIAASFVPETRKLGWAALTGAFHGIGEQAVRPLDPCAEAATHWKSAETHGTVEVFEDHLARFPDCAFAGIARAKVAALKLGRTDHTADTFHTVVRTIGWQNGRFWFVDETGQTAFSGQERAIGAKFIVTPDRKLIWP